jgi:uncharacterized protein YkwD
MRLSSVFVVCAIVAAGCAGEVPEEDLASGDQAAATNLPPRHDLDSEEKDFLVRINQYRAANGLGALKNRVTLDSVAYAHSLDMGTRGYFSHNTAGTDPVVGPFDRMRAAGYGNAAMAENIAAGNATAAATFDQWKNSPGHNTNMLGSAYVDIGIGRACVTGSPYRCYWTTNFGSLGSRFVDSYETTDPDPVDPVDPVDPDPVDPEPPTCPAEPEPNDWPAANLDGRLCGSVSASDDDWYTFTVATTGTRFVVEATGDVKVYVWRRRSSGYTQLANATATKVESTAPVSNARYYVLVDAPADAKYELNLTR